MLWRLTSRWARISPDWKRWRRYARENPGARRARALRVDRAERVTGAGVAKREASVRRQRAAVAREPGRHDAVEHVHAERDGGEELGVGPETHEVAGAVGRELGDARLGHGEHRLDRLPHRQAADGDAVEVEPGDEARGVRVEPSRRTLPGRCRRADARCRGAQPGTARPSDACARSPRARRRLAVPWATGWSRHITTSAPSRAWLLHRILRRHPQPRAVVRRDERRAVVVDGCDLGQAHQLVAAAVGEDRMVPAHECVEPAGLLDQLDPRAEREVVCVAQQDVDARRAHLVGVQRLDRRVRSRPA